MRLRFLFRRLWLAAPVLLGACTTTEQSSEAAAPRSIPTQVVTDADRRAIYNSNSRVQSSTGQPVPDATLNTQRLGEQASDINRVKRPESLNTNDNNNTTPETRVQRLDQSLPDSLRRP